MRTRALNLQVLTFRKAARAGRFAQSNPYGGLSMAADCHAGVKRKRARRHQRAPVLLKAILRKCRSEFLPVGVFLLRERERALGPRTARRRRRTPHRRYFLARGFRRRALGGRSRSLAEPERTDAGVHGAG